jgi:drug/metabolite transporter (DMT)-like permease
VNETGTRGAIAICAGHTVRTRDVAELVLLGAIWGGAFPLLRIAAPVFGAIPLTFVRVTVAAVVLLIVARGFARMRERAALLFLLGLTNTAIPFALFAYATLSITAGLAALLNATTPMFGALVAFAWLGERLTALRIAGILIGFAGVTAIVWGTIGAHGEAAGLGIAAGLAAAAMYGFAANFAKRKFDSLDAASLAAGSVLGAALVLAPAAVLSWPPITPGIGAWAAAIALGLFCTAVAYLIYFRLVAHVGPAKAVTVTFLIPVFGILWGALFLDEPVTPALLASCACVLLGTALATGVVTLPGRAATRAAMQHKATKQDQ